MRITRPGAEGDTGAADPAVTEALDGWARGTRGEHDALTALAASRLVVPVVAMPARRPSARPAEESSPGGAAGSGKETAGSGKETAGAEKETAGAERETVGAGKEAAGAEKETEMALPTLVGKDGRTAVIAFTGTQALARWDPGARPVPFPASRVWQYAAAEGHAVVVDVAGPVPMVVEGARLAALAAGERPPLPHEDPDVRAEIAAVTDGFDVEPGPPGSDFLVALRAAGAAEARRAAEEITARVRSGGRFRRGVGFRVTLYARTDGAVCPESRLLRSVCGGRWIRLASWVAIGFTACFGG